MARLARRLGIVLAALLLLFALLLVMRDGPTGPIAGGRLGGPEVAGPVADWSFSDDFETIAIEVRPDDPHSVTVICFAHEGRLFVPAAKAAEKDWPAYVGEDPRVRLRIGEQVYPGRAARVTDEARFATLSAVAAAKYPQYADRLSGAGGLPEGLWLFEVVSGE
jgi:hypothetical protein